MIVSDALKGQVEILIFDITCFDDIQNKIKELQEPLKRNFGKFRVHLPLPGSPFNSNGVVIGPRT